MKTQLLTVQEVLDQLKISRSTLNRLREAGKLHAHKIGRQVRFDPEDIEGYLQKTKEGQDNK